MYACTERRSDSPCNSPSLPTSLPPYLPPSLLPSLQTSGELLNCSETMIVRDPKKVVHPVQTQRRNSSTNAVVPQQKAPTWLYLEATTVASGTPNPTTTQPYQPFPSSPKSLEARCTLAKCALSVASSAKSSVSLNEAEPFPDEGGAAEGAVYTRTTERVVYDTPWPLTSTGLLMDTLSVVLVYKYIYI